MFTQISSLPPTRALRALRHIALAAMAMLLVLAAAVAPRADAAGSPNLSLSVNMPALALTGDDVSVDLRTSTPPASVAARNLSYRVVLPAGSSYVTGTADAVAGEPTIVSNQPVSGQTTLLWQNVADLAGGDTHDLRFKVRPSTATYGVNTTFTLTADAYAQDDARYVPAFTATGQHDATVAHPSTASDTGRTGSTAMKALEVTETQTGLSGGALLRGLHTQRSIVTLKLRGTTAGTTSSVTLDDYLPAGIEYLGCGGAGADHTTSAATNLGSTEEYPGSGAIAFGAVSGCIAPTTVVAGVVDPPGPQPSGMYTRVRWSLASIGAGATQNVSFAVAAPLRSNTNTWTGGSAPATTGIQAANLDNNNGPEVVSGTTLTDTTSVSGMYVGIVSTTSSQDTSRVVKDLVATKSASSGSFTQGSTTRWDVTVKTGEYRSAANVAITDTVPDGLCPIESSTNLAHAPQDAADATDCATGADPTDPYTSADEQTDGSWQLIWDSSTVPAFSELSPNATRTISYSTRTRGHYQETYADAAPVLAGDTVINAAHVAADARVVCASGAACPGGAPTGTEIDHDGALTTPITDDATAPLTASTGSVDKQVALSGTNCSTAAYTQGIPSYTPGDRICWLTRVDFPGGVDTSTTQVSDFLPVGLTFDSLWNAGGDEATSNDTIGASTFDAAAATPGPGGALRWTLPSSYAAGSSVFEHRIASRLRLPTGGTDGMLVENTFKASLATTQGTEEPLRDVSDVQLRMPVLAETERITAVNGSAITATNLRTVRGGEVLTYRVRVTNPGGRDAEQLEAWEKLPAGLACADVVAVSATGACSGGVVRWGATPTVGPTVPAGGTTDLTFDLLVPTTVEVGQSLITTSGLRQYVVSTNTGGAYTYVPASNIDSTQNPSANVPAANDTVTITGATPTIAESRTTSLIEPANADIQATIGEVVTYTVSTTVPAGLTVRELNVTDNIDVRHNYVTGSLQQTSGPATTLGIAGSLITLTLPTSYTAPTGADTVFTFTFDARVADTTANTRGGPALTNQAVQKYTPFGTANGGAQTSLSAALQSTAITEPALTLQKQVDVGTSPVIGGQVLTYTLTLGTSAGTAHESTLVDHIPVDVTPQNAAGNPIANGESTTSGGVWNAAARTLTFSPNATIVAGTPQVFTYKVNVNIPVVSGIPITNTANATTTSLPGVDAAERVSTSPVTAGYLAASSVTVNVKTASITKTSDVTTRTPGEKVLYTVDVTLPANVVFRDVTIRDSIPDAIDFDGYRPVGAASCISGCTPGNEPVIQPYTPVTNGDGTITAAWDFGDLMTQEPVTRVIRLQYDAHLRLTHRAGGTAVLRSQTTTNTIRVMHNRTDKVAGFNPAAIPATATFDDVPTPASRTITVVEPAVNIAKQIAVNAAAFGVGPVTIHDGDKLHYKVTVTNTGNAPLYDIAVQDTPDAGLRNMTLAAGVTTTTNTDGYSNSDPKMTWMIPGPVAAGATVVLQYDADTPLITSMVQGQHLDNSAQVTASWGVPLATRTADGFLYRSYSTSTVTTRANYDAPKLTLLKTTGAAGNPESSTAEVGVGFPWRVVVTNGSTTETGTQLTFRDTLPKDWRYVPGSATLSGTGGGALTPTIVSDPAGDQLTFPSTAVLAPGQQRTLTYKARPLLAAATSTGTGAGNPHINTASAEVHNSNGADSDAGGIFTSPTDTAQAILNVPTLGIDVTPDATAQPAGSPLSYTVHIENAGIVNATPVQLHATFPSQAPYTPGTATAAPSAGFTESSASATSADWTIPLIAPGDSVDLTVPVTVPASLNNGTQLVLSVDGTAPQVTGTITDDGDVTVVRMADLAASLSANPNPATAGGNLTYSLGVSNNGPSNAKDPAMTMVLPSTVTFTSAASSCTYASGTRTVTCATPGDLAPGASLAANVLVHVNPGAAPGNADATNVVSSADVDPNAPNDSANVTVPIGNGADLQMTNTPSATTVAHGANVTFTLAMKNLGPSDAASAQIVDTLPAGLTYVSNDGGCAVAAQVVTCPASTLANGATRTVHVVAAGTTMGAKLNSAAASSATPDPDNSNDTADATVTVAPAADLQLTLSAPATLPAGGTMTVDLALTSNGPDPATNVAIVTHLASGTVFVGGDPGCGASGTTVTCTVGGGLSNGQTATRQIQVRVPTALADQHLVTSGDGSQTEVDPGGSHASATTVIGPSADLSVSQGGAHEVPGGQDAQLTMTVSNAGPSTATAVEVTGELPVGASLAAVVPPAGATCSIAGQKITCTLASLPAGQQATIQLTVGVPANWVGTTFTTKAAARATTPDPDPVSNDEMMRVTAVVAAPDPTPTPTPEPAPAGGPSNGAGGTPTPTPAPVAAGPRTTLKITQKASAKKLRGGRTITYTVTVKNIGEHDATGIKVCGKLPPGMSFPTQGAGFMSGSQLCFRTKVLAPGKTLSERISARISRRAKKGSVLVGRTSVQADNAAQAVASVKGTVVTDGRVNAETLRGFTG